jgi:hypothetical protein
MADKDLASLTATTTPIDTMIAYVRDPALGSSGDFKVTLNTLFSIINRAVTDGAVRITGVSAPSASASNAASLYHNSSNNNTYISENTGAYDIICLLTKTQTLTNKTLSAPIITGGLQYDTAVVLTDAATVATDASQGNYFRVTLGGNRTLGVPTNPQDTQACIWEFIQDSGSPRSITLAGGTDGFEFGTTLTSITLTNGNGKKDLMAAVYNVASRKWFVTGFLAGF